MKTLLFKHWPLLVIIAVGFVFQFGLFDELPSFIHSWAQSDHLALSYGFLENGFDFFHPQTFHYNHQYPDSWHTVQETTITSVDFPINNYIVAILMKLLGTTNLMVFHIVAFTWSIWGLWGLYKLFILLDDNKPKALFAVLFVASSPLFAYYQISFLPSIPALALAIWGIKNYISFRATKENKYFVAAAILFGFSAMIRTTFIIPFIAVLSVEFLQIISKKSKLLPKLPATLLSFLMIGGYFYYNSILREKYGSIFLSNLMPAVSWEDAKEIINDAYNNWRFTYFSKRQYGIIALVLIAALILILTKKSKLNANQKALLLTSGIYLLGSLLFAIAMLGQFRAHDYYFLDSLFLPVSLLFITLFSSLQWKNNFKLNIITYSCYAFCFFLIAAKTVKSQKDKRTPQPWDKTFYSVLHFKEGKQLLDQLNANSEDRILLIDPCSTNLPFILLERKGYVIMSSKKSTIEGKLDWDYDYVLLQNDYFLEDVYPNYPEITNHLVAVLKGKYVTICKFDPTGRVKSIDEFIDPNSDLIYESLLNGDRSSAWKDYEIQLDKNTPKIAINSEMEFSCNLITDTIQSKIALIDKIVIETKVFSGIAENGLIVVDIENQGEKLYYQTLNLSDAVNAIGKRSFTLNEPLPHTAKLSIYLWNTKKSNFMLDFIHVKLYQR